MGTVIRLSERSLADRLDVLRDFIDEAEAESHEELNTEEQEELEHLISYVWPGVLALETSWVTKLVFAWAGFAIGLGLHP